MTISYNAADLFKPAILALAISIGCSGCGSTAPTAPGPAPDLEFSQSSTAAMIAFDQSDVGTAAKLYQRALKRGRAMDDAAAVFNAASNLAACEIALGQYDPASHHLQEARYNGVASGMNTDDVQLLMAKVAYLRGRDFDAESLAKGLSLSPALLTRLQAQALLTLISCDLKREPDARSRITALREMTANAKAIPPSIGAEVEKAEGAFARLEGRAHDAAEHFDRETALLRASHRYREIIRSLSRSGESHEAAGEMAVAAERYYRAARGSVAMDDTARAEELAAKALAAAKAAGDAELTQMIEQLINEIHAANVP